MTNDNAKGFSPWAQALFEDIDQQLKEMQLSLASSSISGFAMTESTEQDEHVLDDLDTTSEQADDGYALLQGRYSVPSSVYSIEDVESMLNPASSNHSEDEDEDAKFEAWLERGNLSPVHSTEEIDPVSSLTSSSCSEDEDARFEAWLERGNRTAASSDSDSSSTLTFSASPAITPTRVRPALSIFPPTNSTTGKSEYSSPSTPYSPLNNGRDVYGNLIATNPNDYFSARSPETSPPMLPPIRQDPSYAEVFTTPTLRGGGGGWLDNLAIRGKPESAATSADQVATTDKGKVPQKDLLQSGRPREDIPISAGTRPLTNIHSGYGRSDIPSREVKQQSRFNPAPPTSDARGSTSKSVLSTLEPPKGIFLDRRGRPGSPTSMTSNTTLSSYDRAPRPIKRWDKQPSDRPINLPSALAPPIPDKSKRRPQVSAAGPASSTSNAARVKHPAATVHPSSQVQTFRPPSPGLSDLQSLNFGESMSTAAWERYSRNASRSRSRSQRPQGMVITGAEPTAEDIEEWQLNAQADFRSRVQEIMAKYNADKARIDRALQLDQISRELHDKQAEDCDEWMRGELRVAERETGYAILNDEAAIAEALKTRDGYTIYHDILQPTQPDLWHRLDDQHLHHLTQPTHYSSFDFNQPKSSWDQGVHVAGKIARFLFAADPDPELKTFSNRRPVLRANTGVAGIGGAVDFGESKKVDTKKELQKEDKGKERASEEISRRDWAPGSAMARTNTVRTGGSKSGAASSGAAASGSGSRYTGTTAVESQNRFISRTNSGDQRRPERGYVADQAASTSAGKDDQTVASSSFTAWPEGDSQGNWMDVRRKGLRGGSGGETGKIRKERRKNKKVSGEKVVQKVREMHAWNRVDYGSALHLH